MSIIEIIKPGTLETVSDNQCFKNAQGDLWG